MSEQLPRIGLVLRTDKPLSLEQTARIQQAVGEAWRILEGVLEDGMTVEVVPMKGLVNGDR